MLSGVGPMLRLRPVMVACGLAASGLVLSAISVPPALARPLHRVAAPAFRRASEVTLPANADLADGGGVYGIGCAALGACAAGGGYTTTTGAEEAFAVSQVRGAWKVADEVQLPAGAASDPGAEINGVACPAIGYCVAVGDYETASSVELGFIVTESRGRWGTATHVALPANSPAITPSQLMAVACTGRGNCEAVGDYNDSSSDGEGMAVTEVAGHWRRAVEITMPTNAVANPEAFPVSVTCVQAGDCVAAGSYDVAPYPDYVPMVATQTGGRWLRAVPISEPGGAAPDGSAMNSAACWTAGHCVAVGSYAVSAKVSDAMAATESRGRWGRAVEETVSPAAHIPAEYFDSISCAPAAGCVAAGGYQPASGTSLPLTLLYAAGRWEHAVALKLPPGAAAPTAQNAGLYGISCLDDGYCAVGGYYHSSTGPYLPMVATT